MCDRLSLLSGIDVPYLYICLASDLITDLQLAVTNNLRVPSADLSAEFTAFILSLTAGCLGLVSV